VGAASYGMLTTFVRIANQKGFTTFELTFTQYLLGFVGLALLDFVHRKGKKKETVKKPSAKNIRNLMRAGTTLGLTSLIYYFSIQFISVSVAVVLLMQSVWIGVVLDAIFNKTKPGKLKIIAVVIVLAGTVLATNVLFNEVKLDWRGFVLGFMAAVSYSITIFASNRVALELRASTRSKWMALGGLIVVTIIASPFLASTLHPDVFYTWGIFLAIFGVVLPPLLLTSGMPKINLGIGAIITSLELPVAVCLAYFLLGESVNVYQWIGMVLILIAVGVMNFRKLRFNKS
jgi:drug/metabolite transporter (DMT)-like permease